MVDSYSGRDNFSDEFNAQLKLVPEDATHKIESPSANPNQEIDGKDQQSTHVIEDYDDDDEEEEDEDDFSFVLSSDGDGISADDIFQDGQIRPIFPLFNRDLLRPDNDEESEILKDYLPVNPPVSKVFIEASSSGSDDVDGIASGPYCVWSKGTGAASPEVCKKSNSTGFSKLWRFRDLMHRSNSDGRDAFVFLNNSSATHGKKDQNKIHEKSEQLPAKKADAAASKDRVGGNSPARKTNKVKKGRKAETSSLSAYLKSRASDEDRRRSYLPYRPELVGFFTSVNGGLSRNVHPF